jgi:hypothetical protein
MFILFGEPPEMDINNNNLTIEDNVLNDILNRDISEEEIRAAVFSKINKSPGPEMLISFPPFLYKLYNRIFQCGDHTYF